MGFFLALVVIGLSILFWMFVALFTKSWVNHMAAVAVVSAALAIYRHSSHVEMADMLGRAPRSFLVIFLMTLAIQAAFGAIGKLISDRN
jgi:hypothetical protein